MEQTVNRSVNSNRVYSFLSLEGVEVHHGDTESTEGARRFEISNLKFEISNLKPPCNLRVLRGELNSLHAQERHRPCNSKMTRCELAATPYRGSPRNSLVVRQGSK